jgi:hypothetical protein
MELLWPAHLRATADKYRNLAGSESDRATNRRILELTDELEQQAESRAGRPTMNKSSEDQIRKRAQEIWEENHRPDGRDDEFWHQAEWELQQGEDHGDPAKETPKGV